MPPPPAQPGVSIVTISVRHQMALLSRAGSWGASLGSTQGTAKSQHAHSAGSTLFSRWSGKDQQAAPSSPAPMPPGPLSPSTPQASPPFAPLESPRLPTPSSPNASPAARRRPSLRVQGMPKDSPRGQRVAVPFDVMVDSSSTGEDQPQVSQLAQLGSTMHFSDNGDVKVGGFEIGVGGLTNGPDAAPLPPPSSVLDSPHAPAPGYGSYGSQCSSACGSPAMGGRRRTSVNADDGSNLVIIGKLGKGNGGAVLKALYLPTMKLVALKTVTLYNAERRQQMVQELSMLYSNLADIDFDPFSDNDDETHATPRATTRMTMSTHEDVDGSTQSSSTRSSRSGSRHRRGAGVGRGEHSSGGDSEEQEGRTARSLSASSSSATSASYTSHRQSSGEVPFNAGTPPLLSSVRQTSGSGSSGRWEEHPMEAPQPPHQRSRQESWASEGSGELPFHDNIVIPPTPTHTDPPLAFPDLPSPPAPPAPLPLPTAAPASPSLKPADLLPNSVASGAVGMSASPRLSRVPRPSPLTLPGSPPLLSPPHPEPPPKEVKDEAPPLSAVRRASNPLSSRSITFAHEEVQEILEAGGGSRKALLQEGRLVGGPQAAALANSQRANKAKGSGAGEAKPVDPFEDLELRKGMAGTERHTNHMKCV